MGAFLTEQLGRAYGSEGALLNVVVCPHATGDVSVQYYNTLLSLASLSAASDGVWLFHNDEAASLCQQRLRVERPSFEQMNRIIARQMAAVLMPRERGEWESTTATASVDCHVDSGDEGDGTRVIQDGCIWRKRKGKEEFRGEDERVVSREKGTSKVEWRKDFRGRQKRRAGDGRFRRGGGKGYTEGHAARGHWRRDAAAQNRAEKDIHHNERIGFGRTGHNGAAKRYIVSLGGLLRRLTPHVGLKMLSVRQIPVMPPGDRAFSSHSWAGLMKHLHRMQVSSKERTRIKSD